MEEALQFRVGALFLIITAVTPLISDAVYAQSFESSRAFADTSCGSQPPERISFSAVCPKVDYSNFNNTDAYLHALRERWRCVKQVWDRNSQAHRDHISCRIEAREKWSAERMLKSALNEALGGSKSVISAKKPTEKVGEVAETLNTIHNDAFDSIFKGFEQVQTQGIVAARGATSPYVNSALLRSTAETAVTQKMQEIVSYQFQQQSSTSASQPPPISETFEFERHNPSLGDVLGTIAGAVIGAQHDLEKRRRQSQPRPSTGYRYRYCDVPGSCGID